MEQQPYQYSVTSGYGDSFNGRSVKPSAIMGYLEEAAADHCRAIGRDVFTLHDENSGWVLNSASLRIHTYPSYGEKLVVKTWISAWKRFSGIREYRLSRPDGDVLAEGGGRWVFWNILTRKPQAIPGVFLTNWHRREESPYRTAFPDSATPTFPKIPDCQPSSVSSDFRVRRGDIDLYGHLHNTSYMKWLMEAVPDYLYRDYEPINFSLRFFGEALLGQIVRFTTRAAGKGWFHEVRILEDGRLLARGTTEWERRRITRTA